MSDQQQPPTKPKPGSLRDRIAAFEKSATVSTPAPAPAPRPKPAGFSTWKPKPPSRPSTPPAVLEQSTAASAGMSASDAKESITKGGSLKDRMAALQGKGAFGAPPPIAAKPAVEKPKWKPPPPVSAPVDDDDHSATEGLGGAAAAIERSTSPPVAPKPAGLVGGRHSRQNSVEVSSPPPPSGEIGDSSTSTDPQEEERERRAALAARMARLGGARLGMAPPILGKKPPVRKSTQEEQSATEAAKPNDQAATSPEPVFEHPVVSTPEASSVTSSANAPSSPEQRQHSMDYIASKKDSGNASLLSSPSADSQATKSPSSMPIPAVPRRTGPPRKKPAKPSAPPPEVPEEKLTDDVPALDTKEEKIEEPASPPVESSPTTGSVIQDPKIQAPVYLSGVTDDQSLEDPQQHTSLLEGSKPEEPVLAVPDSQQAPEPAEHAPSPPEEAAAPSDTSSEPSPTLPSDSGILPPPPSHVTEDVSRAETAEDDDPTSSSASLLRSPSEAIPPLEAIAAAEEADVATPVPEATELGDDEVAEEEARKKRVAERLAKMGGINPFAPQPLKATSPPPAHDSHTTEVHHSLPTEVISHGLEGVEEKHPESKTNENEEPLDEIESDGSVYEPETEVMPAVDVHENLVAPTSESPEPPVKPPIPQSPPPIPTNRPPTAPTASPGEPKVSVATRSDQATRAYPSRQTSLASDPDDTTSAPLRQVQPPRRLVPQTPSASDDAGEREDDGHSDEDADESPSETRHFVPPPQDQQVAAHPRRRFIQDEDDAEGNGSENDSPALPVPHRRSVEVPPARSIPQPPADEYSETESDHDGQPLPIPPRRVVSPPTIVSSPPPAQRDLDAVETPLVNDHLTPTSLSVGREILDEEEGDPIDPDFHSPSRRASFADLSSAAQAQSPPAPQSPPLRSPPSAPTQLPVRKATDPSSTSQPDTLAGAIKDHSTEDAEQLKRNTIAERMAKLGGIRFGAAPPVPAHRPTPTSPQPDAQQEDHAVVPPTETEPPAELTEEDEERARKERIAAKLANMGGMRIGMMPMGMGGLPPQRSHILRDEPTSPPPPPARQTRPPPALEPESESPSVATSDDGVKVEAEESEAEEVSYQEAQIEEAPPPVPSRMGRQSHRRESTEVPSSPPPPPSRPPVPAPHRRSSVQSTTERPIPQRMESSHLPQSDYVMVEEGENEQAPPLPPGRHAPRSPPHSGVPSMAASQDMASWEIPEFESQADLSLSWTDAGEALQSPPPSHAVPPPPSQPKPLAMDKTLSADDLMALWGRVGVQVCEVATTLFDKSKKTLVGDGTYAGFIRTVLADVPNAANAVDAGQYGYLIYSQTGATVQKRTSDIMPGDVVELHDAKLKGHKGLQAYQQAVGSPTESVVGVIGEFEAKKSKIRVFQANQHVGQQTVESVSYRLEDLKSGTVKVYRVLDA